MTVIRVSPCPYCKSLRDVVQLGVGPQSVAGRWLFCAAPRPDEGNKACGCSWTEA